ncbi:hypothetical protein [Parendozoicomonas sp. Alg238-R29]|uniref:hypothetical protein n=1 Tax=Parendozoicomonas sp. Alg238-R29 TaxID=2993446 RepID=UPI00248D6C5B|nr:hypothetical protein [Parendozoicomonas sp. Alg238-R29]
MNIFGGKISKPAWLVAFRQEDVLSQHDAVAEHLGFVLKFLVTTAGQTVREGVFHLQYVNAYHRTLKGWKTPQIQLMT